MRLLASLAFQGFGAAVLPASAVPAEWRPTHWQAIPLDGLHARAPSAWPRPDAAGCRPPARVRRVDVLRHGGAGRERPAVRGLHAGSAAAAGVTGSPREPVNRAGSIDAHGPALPGSSAERSWRHSHMSAGRTHRGRERDHHRQPHAASRSRSRSSTVASTPAHGRSCSATSGSTTRASRRRRPPSRAITELDGDAGILRYRGYPIEQLAEQSTYLEVAYLLDQRRAADRRSSTRRGRTRSRTTRSSTRTCASGSWRASTTTPTPWACSCRPSPRCRPSTSRPRTSATRDPQQADRPAHRQDADARRLRLPLQRRACRSSIPTTRSTSRRTSCR